MKEIGKVIRDYETRLSEDEEYEKIKDSYLELLFKTRILFKHDLCELIIVDNLDNYTRINSFTNFIVKRSCYYYLHTENESGKLLFITKASYGTGISTGIALGIDHISDEDFEKLLELEENEKLKKINEAPKPLPKELYWLGILLFAFIFLGSFTGPGFTIIVVIGFIIFFYKKQIGEAFIKFNNENTVNSVNIQEEDKTEEKPVETKVIKPKEIKKKHIKNRRKKRERY